LEATRNRNRGRIGLILDIHPSMPDYGDWGLKGYRYKATYLNPETLRDKKTLWGLVHLVENHGILCPTNPDLG
jgi:hypothetical protein